MKQRGMPFTQSLIPHLLSGAKTQTRRVMKPPPYCPGGKFEPIVDGKWLWIPKYENDQDSHNIKSPPHRPGDLIWVREAWKAYPDYDHLTPRQIIAEDPEFRPLYEADVGEHYSDGDSELIFMPDAIAEWNSAGRYRNARFLPKALARIWLRVLDVRPERLQDITEEDAIAEGVESMECGGGGFRVDSGWSYRRGFAHVWGRLHKPPNDWADNGWVWRIEFERTERPA